MNGNGSEYVEDYKYHYTNESDYSHNDTYYEQFLVFYDFRYILWIFVAAPLILLGLLGNIVAFSTFGKFARQNTITFLLRTLAITDSFLLVFMALGMYAEYTGGKIIFRGKQCPTISVEGLGTYIRAYIHPLANINGIVGTWTSVMIGMNRYIVVCRPLQAATLCTVSRARKQMLCITVIAVMYALPRFFEMEIKKKPDGSAFQVDALWGNKWYYYIYFCGVHFICLFSIPFTMLLFFCVRLIAALRTATRRTIKRHGGNQVDTRITSMLVILIAVFLFCQAFLWLYNILRIGPPVTPCIGINSLYIRVFVYTLFIFNSSVNFVIYLVYLKEFRRRLCTKYCHSSQQTGHSRIDVISRTESSAV